MSVKDKLSSNGVSKNNNEVLVSVIVPAYNAGDFLEANVKTYLDQTLENLEIIIVNDGSKDNTWEIAEKLATQDKRIRLVNKQNGGLSSARNAGVEVAQGTYVFFIDPDDYMDNDTLEVLYRSLEKTGSDVAIVGYDLIYDEEAKLPGAWIQKLFSQSHEKLVLADNPHILQASTAWGKLIRTSFYRTAGLSFIDGILYEDQPFTAKMYASAKNGIDTIGAYKMHWVQRDSSISHQVTVDDLHARLNAAQLSLQMLKEFSSETVYHSRLVQNLNNDLRYIMRKYDKVSEAYNDLMFETLPKFYDLLVDKSDLDAVVDVAYRLLAANERDAFSEYLTATNLANHRMKFVNQAGKPVIDWGTLSHIGNFESAGHVLPENFHARTQITSFDQTINGPQMTIQAYITKIDCHEFDYDVRLNLVEVDEKTGQEGATLATLTPIRQTSEPNTIREHKEWWADYSDNFYTFQLPAEFAKFNDTVKLKMDISAASMTLTQDVDTIRPNSTGRWTNLTVSPTAQMRLKRLNKLGNVSYYLKYVPIVTYSVHQVQGQRVSFLVKSGSALKQAVITTTGNTPEARTMRVKLRQTNKPYEYLATVDFGKLGQSNWSLKHMFRHVVLDPSDYQLAFFNHNHNEIMSFSAVNEPVVLADVDAVISNYATGSAKLMMTPVVTVQNISVVDNTLILDTQVQNGPVEGLDITLQLISGKAEKSIDLHLDSHQATQVAVILEHEVFGENKPLPLSLYTLSFMKHDGTEQAVIYEEQLIKSLPTNQYVDGYHSSRIDFNYTKQKLRLQLFNQMVDTDKGGYGWGKMMTRYLQSTEPTKPNVVLFRTYYGESVTDNAVALTQEILKDPTLDLEIYWAVQNQQIEVPAGTHQVIVNSAQWFELLATAGTVVENVHQINYMVKKPGQRIVQAFHGYPYKQMGRTYYQAQDYDMSRVKSFEKREAQWDYILSPAPYATPLYLDSFNFNGKVLEVGHPRNDILVAADRTDERAEIDEKVRMRLNIAPDKKIVLYAPTYRDYASDTEFKSSRVDFVDYDTLAQKLGDEYVVLVRGHMMNRRAGDAVEIDNVIDVTTYPEILDLIIASDMAVLDYSSLRFDYAQTGKPMIFLVPDLELYEETRGGLMPYLPTAPGWIVNTEAELIEAITHSEDYMPLYGDAWQTFRKAYTPLDDGHAAARMVTALFKDDSK